MLLDLRRRSCLNKRKQDMPLPTSITLRQLRPIQYSPSRGELYEDVTAGFSLRYTSSKMQGAMKLRPAINRTLGFPLQAHQGRWCSTAVWTCYFEGSQTSPEAILRMSRHIFERIPRSSDKKHKRFVQKRFKRIVTRAVGLRCSTVAKLCTVIVAFNNT